MSLGFIAGKTTLTTYIITLASTQLELAMFAGVNLTGNLTGPVGAVVDIQVADSPDSTVWKPLETISGPLTHGLD